MTTDAALIQQWIDRRDPEAFAEITRRHAGMVYGTCVRIVFDRLPNTLLAFPIIGDYRIPKECPP